MANTNMISSSNHNSNNNININSTSSSSNNYNNNNHNSNAYNTYNNYNSVSADSGNSSGSNNNNSSGVVVGSGSEVQTLREVCNMLNTGAASNYMIPTGGCPYDHIITMMRGLNLQDDGIVLNNKIKAIETDFCNIVRDESMLCESMDYMNNKALTDAETALKFALLFSSRNFDALAMKETKVRSAMLKILETNFINADAYRQHDKNRLYNSITLLGEYYHRVRLADNAPITILGDSLLNLLTREINDISVVMSTRLARLVLSQISLNGEIMRSRHKADIDQLLFHVRRHLIMQPALTAKVKAMLLMVLDLFYSHFKHVGNELEAMYTDYLVVDDDEEESFNNNSGNSNNTSIEEGQQTHDRQHESGSYSEEENGSSANNSAQEKPKKWSEQVCEDSLCDIGYGEEQQAFGTENIAQGSYQHNDPSHVGRQARRGYQPRHVPRPLKQSHNQPPNVDSISSDQYPSMASSEDRDETKPLPSWRKTRFNRPNDDQNGRSRHDQQRRYSISCDDDHQSVRSDGGANLRLYSIQDRRKHSQERYERNLGGGANYNSIVNSNWDQRDDRSERSYISNYERGNSYKRGGRYNNHNRNTYDKPPRFQKQQQQQQLQQQQQHSQQQHKDHQKIHSETWRRSNTAINNAYQDENCAFNSNGPESNSRSSSRARTLPRPAKSQMEEGGRKSNYRYAQSPTRGGGSQGGGGGGGGAGGQRSYPRYSSQSSLASEASSTFDRRQPPRHTQNQHQHQPQRHRNFTRRSQPNIHQPDEHQQGQLSSGQQQQRQSSDNNWHESGKDDSELVRNAQQTTKYMNYLSAKK